METVIRIVRAPELPGFFTEGKDFQIAQVILRVIAGGLDDVIVDGLCGIGILHAELLQQIRNLLQGCVFVMNHDIHQGVKAQLQASVVCFQPGGERCRFLSVFR